MKITIRTPKIQDYDRFSNIMDTRFKSFMLTGDRMYTNRQAH